MSRPGPIMRFVARVLLRLGGGFARLGELCACGSRMTALRRWREDRGEQRARLDYALGPESLVWDVGGFEGQWASDVSARFGCRVRVFEPAPDAASGLRWRFAANPRLSVHEFALGGADGVMFLALRGDASGIRATGEAPAGREAKIQVRDVVAVMDELGAEPINLLKLNIEGGEYDLLDRLVSSGRIADVHELQIQFHDFWPDAVARREKLEAALSRTHARTWCYEFVWENWRRRDGAASP